MLHCHNRASGNLPWYWPGAGKPQMQWLQKVIEIETETPKTGTPKITPAQTPGASRMHTPGVSRMGSASGAGSFGIATPKISGVRHCASAPNLTIAGAGGGGQSSQASPMVSYRPGPALDDMDTSSHVASLAEWRQLLSEKKRHAQLSSSDAHVFAYSSSDESEPEAHEHRHRGRSPALRSVSQQRQRRTARTDSCDRWNTVRRHNDQAGAQGGARADNRGGELGRVESVFATFSELQQSVLHARPRKQSGRRSGSHWEQVQGEPRARARALAFHDQKMGAAVRQDGDGVEECRAKIGQEGLDPGGSGRHALVHAHICLLSPRSRVLSARLWCMCTCALSGPREGERLCVVRGHKCSCTRVGGHLQASH
jgi:hypothetical protein